RPPPPHLTDASPSSLQEEDEPGGKRCHHQGGRRFFVEESHRGAELAHLYKGSKANTDLGLDPGYPGLSLIKQSTDNRRFQGESYEENGNGVLTVSHPGIQNQTGEIQHNTIPINKALVYDDKLSKYESESPIRQGKVSQKGSQQTDQRAQDKI
ncbi:hypothetical protein AYI68_g4542, partial [Smittium mucronatum]